MASWETEVTQSTYDANGVISNMETNRNRDTYSNPNFIERITGSADSNGASLGTLGGEKKEGIFGRGGIEGYSIVGINGNQVSNMCAAIQDYVTAVQTKLQTALDTTEANLNTGFRGSDAEASVKTYLDKVRDYVKNLTSALNAFQSKINDVGNAWRTSQSSIGTVVNSSANSFSAGDEYTQQVQYGGPSGSNS